MKLRHCIKLPPHYLALFLLVTETLLSTYALHVNAGRSSALSGTAVRSSSSSSGTSSSLLEKASITNNNNNNNKNVLVSNGLVNLGNTCYLNSQIQCAFHIPHIRSLVLNHNHNPLAEEEQSDETDEESETEAQSESNESGDESEDDDDGSSLSPGFVGLRSVFSQMVQSATAASKNDSQQPAIGLKSPVSTALFCRSLGINSMEQQDAQEFWKLLLPHLKCEPLMDLYHGVYEDYITALDGSHRERRRQERFLDLSLEVESGSAMEALKSMFTEAELLSESNSSGGNGWRPEKGAPKVDALKGTTLRAHGLPSLLQLHLKRFTYDWQTDVMSKLNHRFAFPLELDLTDICEESESDQDEKDEEKPQQQQQSSSESKSKRKRKRKIQDPACVYDLQSIIIHTGRFGSGHYYAYCRPNIHIHIDNDIVTVGKKSKDNNNKNKKNRNHNNSNSKQQWYRFDDSRVTPVTYRDVVADAFGGKVRDKRRRQEGVERRRRSSLSFFGRLFGATNSNSFGYGGRESCAYMLQYVKRSEIPLLYENGNGTPP